MAHEICEFDNMVSIYDAPWHGLGIVLPDFVEIREAQELAGLTWEVEKKPILYGSSNGLKTISDNFVNVRTDIDLPLGVVGKNYVPYQNDQMFEFLEKFADTAGSKLETCGSLRNGQVVWGLLQAGSCEYVKNDPVNKYFLVKNGFNGLQNVEICFTDVRVVCQNTLNMALKSAKNVWNVRHTAKMNGALIDIEKSIFAQKIHSEKMAEFMSHLSGISLNSQQIQSITQNIIFPQNKLEESEKVMSKQQFNTIGKILELVDSGAGTEIAGVRGTAYGLAQAFTEYADHHRTIKSKDRSIFEAKFESNLLGSSAAFKADALQKIYQMAA